MSLIKAPTVIEKKVVSVSMPKSLIREVDRYAKWISAERGHVICEAVRLALANDEEWNGRSSSVEEIRKTA